MTARSADIGRRDAAAMLAFRFAEVGFLVVMLVLRLTGVVGCVKSSRIPAGARMHGFFVTCLHGALYDLIRDTV